MGGESISVSFLQEWIFLHRPHAASQFSLFHSKEVVVFSLPYWGKSPNPMRNLTAFRCLSRLLPLLWAMTLILGVANWPTNLAKAAPPPSTVTQIGGANRFATAADIAHAAFPHGAATAIVVSGAQAHLIDALTAAPLAHALNAPILLAQGATQLGAPTLSALSELHVQTVWLIGATAAMPASQLPSGVTVARRIAGSDRFDTAAQIAAALAQATGNASFGSAVVTSGENAHLIDALAAAPFAAAQTIPILLAASGEQALPAGEMHWLAADANEYGVGAAAHYGLNLPGKWIPIAGQTRYETAVLLDRQFETSANPYAGVAVANGGDLHLADALAAAPWVGARHLALVLASDQSQPPPAVSAYLATASVDPSGSVVLLGGTASLPPGLGSAVRGLMPTTALSPADVYFYAAYPQDVANADAAASAAQIPSGNVISDFSTAWNLVTGGRVLVIAVGSAAANALAGNPCGWPHPSAGPFPFVADAPGAAVSPISPGHFVNANGLTSQDTAALAKAAAIAATTGRLPAGSALPAVQAPAYACQGSPGPAINQPVPAHGILNGLDTNYDLTSIAVGNKTPYQFTARYLGGVCYPASPKLTADEVRAIHATGAKLISIYSGANNVPGAAVCGHQTAADGTANGLRAAKLAQNVGQPTGSAIYLDMEPLQSGSQWVTYVKAWSAAVASQGYLPGIYSGPLQLARIDRQTWGGSKILYWVTQWNYRRIVNPPPDPTTQLGFATLWQYAGDVQGPSGLPGSVDFDSALGTRGMW